LIDKISGMVLAFRDQSEERAAQKALRENDHKFRNTLACLDEGFEDIINVINGLGKSKEKIKWANLFRQPQIKL